MLKILNYILTNLEKRLSKKENCLWENETSNEKLILYRKLLDEIDRYNFNEKGLFTFRHYRYNPITIDYTASEFVVPSEKTKEIYKNYLEDKE